MKLQTEQPMNAFHDIEAGSLRKHPSENCVILLDPVNRSHCFAKILLLQGPVGPFFSDLHRALQRQGFSVRRVLFNAGDRLFDAGNDSVPFMGSVSEWDVSLHFEFAQNRPDTIILFGSNRPAHESARRIAKLFNIPVVCLEEGYLRSGYISCELGGNNQNSPMVNWTPDCTTLLTAHDKPKHHTKHSSSFLIMSCWGALYYLARDIFSATSQEGLFHRKRERLLPLSVSWIIHATRRIAARICERPRHIGLRRAPGYILVPLQVASDSQLQTASRGWSTPKLIESCLRALVLCEKNHPRIVFKLHPLERNSPAIKQLILRRVKAMGLPPPMRPRPIFGQNWGTDAPCKRHGFDQLHVGLFSAAL